MNQITQDTADHETAVSTLYGSLTDVPLAARVAHHLDPLAQQVVTVFAEHLLPIAHELVGDTPADRAVAREAVMSLLLTRLNDQVQEAEAALALSDEPSQG